MTDKQASQLEKWLLDSTEGAYLSDRGHITYDLQGVMYRYVFRKNYIAIQRKTKSGWEEVIREDIKELYYDYTKRRKRRSNKSS